MENLAAIYGSIRDLIKNQKTDRGLQKVQREAELLEGLCQKALRLERAGGAAKRQILDLQAYARNVMQAIDFGDLDELQEMKVHLSDPGAVQQFPLLKMAQRVAQRYIQAAGPGLGDEMIKSLNSLAKYNNGFWKSEKQAAYLLKVLDADSKHTDKDVVAWIKKQPWYAPDQIVVESIHRLEAYGKRDVTKARFVGQVFVVDGGGIVARMKGKVKHPRKDDPSSLFIIPSTLEATFERDMGAAPPVTFDWQGAKAQAEQARLDQIAANQKLIEQIKKIPRWDQQEIFKDFIAQLEYGGTLSPGQLRVIKKNLPEADVDFGDPEDLMKLYKEVIQLIEDKLVRPGLKDLKDEGEVTSKDYLQGMSAWAKYKKNPKDPTLFSFHHEGPTQWDLGSAINSAVQAGTNKYVPFASADLLGEAWDHISRAVNAIKRNKAPTKKALKMIRFLGELKKALERASYASNFATIAF